MSKTFQYRRCGSEASLTVMASLGMDEVASFKSTAERALRDERAQRLDLIVQPGCRLHGAFFQVLASLKRDLSKNGRQLEVHPECAAEFLASAKIAGLL